jgi:hypothetical protein
MTCGCQSPPAELAPVRALTTRPAPRTDKCACKGAGGSCSCADRHKHEEPPSHPDGAADPLRPDIAEAGRVDLERPPVAVPPWIVIRCRPAYEESRPLASFIDCEQYATLLGGSAARQPFMAEPPQALESSGADEAEQDWSDVARVLQEDKPRPEAVAPANAAAQCTQRASVLARFSTMPLCRNQTLDLPASDGSGLFSPVSPEARGKGGGGAVPCECKCSCPPKWVVDGGILRPPNSALDLGVPFWLQPSTPPPIRPPLGGGLGPMRVFGPEDAPGGGPIPMPFPYPLSSGGTSATSTLSSPGAGRGGTTPGRPGSTAQQWEHLIVSPEAPAEEVFESECPWCGGVRRTPKEHNTRRTDTAERPTELEPPQFVPADNIEPGPGSLSLGSPASPPLHSANIADPAVLAPSGSTSQAQRQVHLTRVG